MRNKELVQRKLRNLKGLLSQLDSFINRGGTIQEINQKQTEVKDLLGEIDRLIDRE